MSCVSVIIPVYNVEKYLDRCITSLVSQSYQKLEIILVEDCTPDGSARICDQWAKRDTRIKVIHKETNEGQGIARNIAMDMATGEYICFIDSDDYIEKELLTKAHYYMEEKQYDFFSSGLCNKTAD